jgi:hypothetical protein
VTRVVAIVAVCLWAVAVCTALTVYATVRTLQAARRRCRVRGTVLEFTEAPDYGERWALVEFAPARGFSRQSWLSATWAYAPGDQVTVRYCADDPESSCIQPALGIWTEPLAVTALAVLCWWTFLAVALFGHDVSVA